MKVFALNTLLIENIMYCDSLARNKNIEIKLENNVTEFAFCDKNMVDTVLRNLITNSIKYSYENGKIDVTNPQLLDK